MKNVLYILAIIACVGMIIFGVMQKNQRSEVAVTPTQDDTGASTPIPSVSPSATSQGAALKAVSDAASAVSSTPIAPDTVHYRPDQSSSSAASQPADDARNFIITPEIVARKYLTDKYKPGTCFGAPVAIAQIAIESLVGSNPAFSDYLRQAYGLKTDLEVYNKIKQFQGITLTATASGVFKYVFSDGQCQTVSYQEGVVTVSGFTASDTVTLQESHTY